MRYSQPHESSWTEDDTVDTDNESDHLDPRSLARRLFDQYPSLQGTREPGTDSPTSNETPHSIAGYQVKKHIGRGAFGNVYLCQEQHPPHRYLAIKVIRAGMDTSDVLARFEAEKNALSMMNHPAIARILDAGVTEDGNPYFAMEHVEGVPLTKFCSRNRLTLEERLRLFIEICQGVQHAHNKAVVHRDLKPSNIMVTEVDGKTQAKIIDFGLVKSLQQPLRDQSIHTQYGVALGTFEYMSPEQVKSGGIHIDTRSDIYALGAILYELLTGELAFTGLRECGYEEIVQRIMREDAVRPSQRIRSGDADRSRQHAATMQSELNSLSRCLATDLDWITMKAMEKDPERRYQACQEMANDIERYLNGELVEARPPSTTYRLKKTVRRYRKTLTVTSLLILSLLMGMSWALIERNSAQTAAKERTAVVDYLEVLYSDIDQDAMAASLRNDFLAQARSAGERNGLSGESLDDHLLAAEQSISRINWTCIGKGALKAGLFKSLTREIEFQADYLPLTRASLLQIHANSLRENDFLDDAINPQEKALDIRIEELGQSHRDTLFSFHCKGLLQVALSYEKRGKQKTEMLETARRTLQTVHNSQSVALGVDDPDTLNSLHALGQVLFCMIETKQATVVLNEVIKLRKNTLGEGDPKTQDSMFLLGTRLSSTGYLTEAYDLLQRVLQHRQDVLPADHSDLHIAKLQMGKLLMIMEDPQQAQPLVEEAVAGLRISFTSEHPRTLDAVTTLASLLHDLGRTDEAVSLYEESLEGFRRLMGDDHPATLRAINLLGTILMDEKKYERALPLLEKCLAGRRRAFPRYHIQIGISCHNLGKCFRYIGNLEQAEVVGAEAVEIILMYNSRCRPIVMDNYSRTLVLMNRFEEAEDLILKAWSIIQPCKNFPVKSKRTVLEGLVFLYKAWNKAEPSSDHDMAAIRWQVQLDSIQSSPLTAAFQH